MKTAGGRKPIPAAAAIAALVPITIVVVVAMLMSAGSVGAIEPGPVTTVTETITATETVTAEVTVTATATVTVTATATVTAEPEPEPTPSGTFEIGEADSETPAPQSPDEVCLAWDLERGIEPAPGEDPCSFAVQDGDGPWQTPPGYTGGEPGSVDDSDVPDDWTPPDMSDPLCGDQVHVTDEDTGEEWCEPYVDDDSPVEGETAEPTDEATS